jgi:hypothetical protein
MIFNLIYINFYFRINTIDETATVSEDYQAVSQTVNFVSGETEKTVSVNIINDKLVEDNQTFNFSLTGSGGSTVFPECKTATVTIVSNDGKFIH